ncbi:MAG: hypothetical protein AAGA30_18090 [Planctomycetota bacterium]
MNNDSYATLLAPLVTQYRKKSYKFWEEKVTSRKQITFEVHAPDGTLCCVEIQAFWDSKPFENIRVMFAISDGSRDAFMPYCEGFILGPDGAFVGE